MKLRFSGTSPFVRKVVIQALETGLDSNIERIITATTDPASTPPTSSTAHSSATCGDSRRPSGRKRFNVLGAIDAVTRELTTVTNDTTIDATAICE